MMNYQVIGDGGYTYIRTTESTRTDVPGSDVYATIGEAKQAALDSLLSQRDFINDCIRRVRATTVREANEQAAMDESVAGA